MQVKTSTRRWLAPLLAGATAIGALALPAPAGAQAAGLPSVGTDFAATGPYRVTQESDGQNTFFYPANPGEGGVEHPVILWGNGIGTTVSIYSGLLRHYASHGFVVAAANGSAGGDGAMLAGLDKVEAWNGQSGHALAGAVDLENVGATGHSLGGFGAASAGRDPRVDTVFPIQGGSGTTGVRSAIYFAGGADAIVSPSLVRSGYRMSRVPAAYAELRGASHFVPIGNGGAYRGPTTAWARAELAGDGQAAALFRGGSCGLCSDPQWTYETNDQFGSAGAPDERPPAETPADPAPPASPAPGDGFGGGGIPSFGGGSFGGFGGGGIPSFGGLGGFGGEGIPSFGGFGGGGIPSFGGFDLSSLLGGFDFTSFLGGGGIPSFGGGSFGGGSIPSFGTGSFGGFGGFGGGLPSFGGFGGGMPSFGGFGGLSSFGGFGGGNPTATATADAPAGA